MTLITLFDFQWLVWVILVNHLLHCFIFWNCCTVCFVCSKLILRVQHLYDYMDSNLGEDNDGNVTAFKGNKDAKALGLNFLS